MSVRTAVHPRQPTLHIPDSGMQEQQQSQAQQQAQPQQFSDSSFSNAPIQMAQQVAGPQGQRRTSTQTDQGQAGAPNASGLQSQVPLGYLQAQILRQRQAAAAANWAMHQERNQPSTQRLGSAILRLLNYSEQLNSFSELGNIQAWKKFIDDFYIDPALYTQSLPHDGKMSYELPTPLLPAYFHRLHLEISKLNLTFHDAREYYLPTNKHVVECPKCTLCFYFPNATKIEMLGRLRVVYAPGPMPNSLLKIERWEFTGESWQEWVCRMPAAPAQPHSNDESTSQNKEGGAAGKESEKSDAPGKKEDNPQSDDNDHEDLFGRSPSGSVPATSRPNSRAQNRPMHNSETLTADLNVRKCFVLPDCGITARHMRFLEISDVLGQISPLFSRNSPNVTLKALLASLPALPVESVKVTAREGQALPKSTNSATTSTSAKGVGDAPLSTSTSQNSKAAQIPSGKAMQLQAAQVLQKQAAQTLSQALPPPDLDFHEKANDDGAAEEKQENLPETEDDLFDSPVQNGSAHESLNGIHSIKTEAVDEAVEASGEIDIGIDLDMDLDIDLDAQNERDSDFDPSESFSGLPVDSLKRANEEPDDRAKRLKASSDAGD